MLVIAQEPPSIRVYDLRRAFTLLRDIDMRMKLALPSLLVVCVVTLGCSDGHLPSSPSSLTSPGTASTNAGRLRGFDDPAMPMPTPMQVLINIVGSFGSTAFMGL